MTLEARDKLAIKAYPLGFCAGVRLAIDGAKKILEEEGPAYVYGGNVVNNNLVNADLRMRGAIPIERINDIPGGSIAMITAHGVSQRERQELSVKGLKVIDLTCPLVQKVHDRKARAKSLAQSQGLKPCILYICKPDFEHREVVGVLDGEENFITPITTREQVDQFTKEPGKMYFVDTQTTLNYQKALEWIEVLQQKIPELRVPSAGDVCYATKNRQNALRLGLEQKPSLMLVFGSTISSNTKELVKIGTNYGVETHLLEEASLVTESLVRDRNSILVTAGASVPLEEPDRALAILSVLGYRIEELRVAEEPDFFKVKPRVFDTRSI